MGPGIFSKISGCEKILCRILLFSFENEIGTGFNICAFMAQLTTNKIRRLKTAFLVILSNIRK